MSESAAPSVTKIYEVFKLPGFLLDQKSLDRIDGLSKIAICSGIDESKVPVSFTVTVTIFEEEKKLEYKSLDVLIAHIEKEGYVIKSMELQYRVTNHSGINISFEKDGKIELSAFSNRIDFQFNIDKLRREIKAISSEYSWPVRKLVIANVFSIILIGIIFLISISVLLDVSNYMLAKRIGVNVDPSLLSSGNMYYQDVEKALGSESEKYKLDILLKGQFKQFVNASDYIDSKVSSIRNGIISVLFCFIVLILTIIFRKLYPLSFFSFGKNISIHQKMVGKRELWVIAIFLAFSVNIIAGLVVAFITK